MRGAIPSGLRSDEGATREDGISKRPGGERGEQSPRILVVEDDARLRGQLSRYLTDNGYRVTAAEDAAEARDRLRFLQPDLLVLDVMMPGESGLALTEALRREQVNLPVLLLTARGSPEDRIAGFEAGAGVVAEAAGPRPERTCSSALDMRSSISAACAKCTG